MVKPRYVIAGAVALAVTLGSIHAFSIFLGPLEERFEASRGGVSLSYSFALLSLTAAVLAGPLLYGRISPARLCLAAALIASAGVVLAASAPNLVVFWIGYGMIFGFGNGLGYGFALQIAGQALPGREGIGMGSVTAGYGFGAVAAPVGFEVLISEGGVGLGLGALATALVLTGMIAAGLLTLGNAVFHTDGSTTGERAARLPMMLWVTYFCGVFAGLMALGHATGILKAAGAVSALWLAPVAVALANTLASFLAGILADRYRWRPLMVLIPIISATALLIVAGGIGGLGALAALGIVGACYGATITLWPTVIAKHYGADGPRIYGRVFTGWGIAGMSGPWLAGALFDATGGYGVALTVAAILAAFAAVTAALLQLPA